jgi:hypothetical protein
MLSLTAISSTTKEQTFSEALKVLISHISLCLIKLSFPVPKYLLNVDLQGSLKSRFLGNSYPFGEEYLHAMHWRMVNSDHLGTFLL